jgi:alanine racemase
MTTSRRAFLVTTAAAGAAGLAGQPRPAAVPAVRDSSFDPWVEVHPQNLRHNVGEIRRRVGGRPILAVIKNNGYGLGIVNVARVLEPLQGIAGLAVVKLHEAVTLRDAGVRLPILLMGPTDDRELDEAVRRDVTPMVYTPVGPLLDGIAARRQKKVALHACVDTGIGRVGVPYAQAPPLLRDLAGRKSVDVRGVMMTFTEDPDFDKEQLGRFTALCDGVEHEGLRLGRRHAAASFALFQRPDAFLDMVRPGMAVFGVYPEQEFRTAGVMDLRPAMALRARVVYVKQLQPGESAGYNRAYVAKEPVWLATLPVGHADGLPRDAARGGRVRINGSLYPIVASVSASHSIVEIGAARCAEIGDVATFFDWSDGSRPEDFGAACKSSVYDLTMHVNPLLPRRLLTLPPS